VTDLRRVYTFSAPSPAQQALIDAIPEMRCGTSGCGGTIAVYARWEMEGMRLRGERYMCAACEEFAKGNGRAK
jgi:hypothetical protein